MVDCLAEESVGDFTGFEVAGIDASTCHDRERKFQAELARPELARTQVERGRRQLAEQLVIFLRESTQVRESCSESGAFYEARFRRTAQKRQSGISEAPFLEIGHRR